MADWQLDSHPLSEHFRYISKQLVIVVVGATEPFISGYSASTVEIISSHVTGQSKVQPNILQLLWNQYLCSSKAKTGRGEFRFGGR